jgi:hypothetical protein
MSNASPNRIISDLVQIERAVRRFERAPLGANRAEAHDKIEMAGYIPAYAYVDRDSAAAADLWFELRSRYYNAIDAMRRAF